MHALLATNGLYVAIYAILKRPFNFKGFLRNSSLINHFTLLVKQWLTSTGTQQEIIAVCEAHDSFLFFSYTFQSVSSTYLLCLTLMFLLAHHPEACLA